MGHHSAGLVDGLIGKCYPMVWIVDDIEPVSEDLAHSAQLAVGHIDGHDGRVGTLGPLQKPHEGLGIVAVLGVQQCAQLPALSADSRFL
jgi:hypothetical protein